jgi:DnaJ family protein B protein 4
MLLGKGHETVHRTVSDLYFQIKEIAHSLFVRSGDDLIYTHNLSLADALDAKSIVVPTLDGRKISIGLDQIPTYIYYDSAHKSYKRYPVKVS